MIIYNIIQYFRPTLNLDLSLNRRRNLLAPSAFCHSEAQRLKEKRLEARLVMSEI
jgi:hypothetical protein